MDGTMIISILLLVAVLVAMGLVGYKHKKKAKAHMAQVTSRVLCRYPQVELLGEFSYHGGFPQKPKPAILQLGLTGDSLLLYDDQGWSDKVFVQDWRGVERFTLLTRADTAGRSTVLLGPLVPYFFRDKLRHFITVKYKDINREENHLLFEMDNEALQQQMYDKFFGRWQKATY